MNFLVVRRQFLISVSTACDNLNIRAVAAQPAMHTTPTPLHTIDLIRKKRDGRILDDREIGYLVSGAASGSICLFLKSE
jgi:hypothetical protein